jgi:hypothetical protein
MKVSVQVAGVRKRDVMYDRKQRVQVAGVRKRDETYDRKQRQRSKDGENGDDPELVTEENGQKGKGTKKTKNIQRKKNMDKKYMESDIYGECTRATYTESARERHIRRVHESDIYGECTRATYTYQCTRATYMESARERHIRRVHESDIYVPVFPRTRRAARADATCVSIRMALGLTGVDVSNTPYTAFINASDVSARGSKRDAGRGRTRARASTASTASSNRSTCKTSTAPPGVVC